MLASLMAVIMVFASLALPATRSHVRYMAVGLQDVILVCTTDRVDVATPAPASTDPDLLTDRPDDSDVIELGSGIVSEMPTELPPSIMTLRLIGLTAGSATIPRTTYGPILYYVLSGNVRMSVGGTGADYEPGDSVMVLPNKLYSYRSLDDQPVKLLKLSLVPSDKEGMVGANGTPVVIDVEEAKPEAVESVLLVRGRFSTLPAEGVRLFIACLGWTDSSDTSIRRQSGPVGWAVLDGLLSVDQNAQLAPGGCRLFKAFDQHEIGAAAMGSTTVLLAGALPADEPLWRPVANPSTMPPVNESQPANCSGQ